MYQARWTSETLLNHLGNTKNGTGIGNLWVLEYGRCFCSETNLGFIVTYVYPVFEETAFQHYLGDRGTTWQKDLGE
ncbi:MAG: hypothetical protein N3F08_00955 [Crenarchaeota archaeon]|nr:hypothetical protein [Thermoproteota archaeon]